MVQAVAPSVEQAAPPGDAVARSPVTVLPLSAGAVHPTVTEVSPGASVTPVGGPGTPGVIGTAADAGPGPAVPTARTLIRYGLPLASPTMLHAGSEAVAVHDRPPGSAVAR
jgi:hypothetical protein